MYILHVWEYPGHSTYRVYRLCDVYDNCLIALAYISTTCKINELGMAITATPVFH